MGKSEYIAAKPLILLTMLRTNKWFRILEIVVVFSLTAVFIELVLPLAGESAVMQQAVIWTANVLMLLMIWIVLRLRGRKFSELGLSIGKITPKTAWRTFLLSILVLALAVIAFLLGSVIMVNITGMPDKADLTGYDYLQGNLPLLLLTLTGVYIVSSFGEEVIYRGFIITQLLELGRQNKFLRASAILVSAMIFGIIHYRWGPMGMVQTGFMGLIFGFFYLRLNQRLWILVLAHAYMDTILMLQLYRAKG